MVIGIVGPVGEGVAELDLDMLDADVLVEDIIDNAAIVVAEMELEEELDNEEINWYSGRPFGPPHISAVLPAHVIEHLPSVVIVEPAVWNSPQ